MKTTDSLFLSLELNANGEVPNRIQVLPAGTVITGYDGRSWNNPEPVRVAESSNRRLPVAPIDENHATDLVAPSGGSAPAMGWMRNFTVEKDGSIWADVEWTSRGHAALKNREYRFISPAFTNSDGKIDCIVRAALTNNPNLKLPALNHQEPEQPAKENYMDKELCAALGLPATAGTAEILAAIEKLKQPALNHQQVDLTVYAPRADLNAMEARAVAAEKQVAELNASGLKAEAEQAVNAAVTSRKIAPASKEAYLGMCSTREGLNSFKTIMESTPALIAEASQVPAGAPAAGGKVELNASEKELASSMGYTLEEYRKMKEAGE